MSGDLYGMSEHGAQAAAPKVAPGSIGRSLLLILIGLGLGIAADRFIIPPKAGLEIAPRPEASRSSVQAAFSRVGNRIVVPDGSPLRTRLALEEPLSSQAGGTHWLTRGSATGPKGADASSTPTRIIAIPGKVDWNDSRLKSNSARLAPLLPPRGLIA
jgi:hypothetical protein